MKSWAALDLVLWFGFFHVFLLRRSRLCHPSSPVARRGHLPEFYYFLGLVNNEFVTIDVCRCEGG
jgi:hypothetical protein